MELNALPTLVLMLQSEDPSVHGESVGSFILLWIFGIGLLCLVPSNILLKYQIGAIGNLVHSSPDIKKDVIRAGALQPVIGLLRYAYFLYSVFLLLLKIDVYS